MPQQPHPDQRAEQRVAVVIPAKDEAERIAATVRACRAIPRVDLVVVVDDGSTDGTQAHARAAGASLSHAWQGLGDGDRRLDRGDA